MATEKIPQYEIDSLVRTFLPDIKEFFKSNEGKKEFEEWLKQKNQTTN